MDLILQPVRIATSKPAQRTYLNTALFLIASTFLFGIACVAYGLFYWNHVPSAIVSQVAHLQFGDGPDPYAVVPLNGLVRGQEYDVTLTLDLPRSPTNLQMGNFMVELRLLSAGWKPQAASSDSMVGAASRVVTSVLDDLRATVPGALVLDHTLYRTRRPALLTYHDPLASLSQRLLRLPLYALRVKREAEVLSIALAEMVTFSATPTLAFLELQHLGANSIDVYSATVTFAARFRPFSLRWLMYNHRILSFVLFSTSFWAAELIFAGMAWLILSYVLPSAPARHPADDTQDPGIKRDDESGDELSDTPRTFPTYGRQPPLKYELHIKHEDEPLNILDETAIQPLAGDGDDELEGRSGDERGRSDSGLGTSYSEGGRRGTGDLLRRRPSRGKAPVFS